MTREEQNKILELEKLHERITAPGFICSLCKKILNISTCDGCPVYNHSFNSDLVITQEHKKLLLQDLCSRIPYGVRCRIEDPVMYDLSFILHGIIEDEVFLKHSYATYEIKNIKPYLFPMSSMTEEQFKEYWELEHSGDMEHLSIPALNWLLKNHFDIYGLMPKGLALDATGLNIY